MQGVVGGRRTLYNTHFARHVGWDRAPGVNFFIYILLKIQKYIGF